MITFAFKLNHMSIYLPRVEINLKDVYFKLHSLITTYLEIITLGIVTEYSIEIKVSSLFCWLYTNLLFIPLFIYYIPWILSYKIKVIDS